MRFYPIIHLRTFKEQCEVTPYPLKKACHPMNYRVIESTEFDVHSPHSLVGAGFASMGVGMFNIFRISPILFYNIITRLKDYAPYIPSYKVILLSTIFAWQGTICFILFAGGILLLCSNKIKKRCVLMLHPWGALLLYFDVFVWGVTCLFLNIELTENNALNERYFNRVNVPFLLFVVIYLESAFYYAGFCLYATYFIAAELAVIERFY